MGRWLESDYVAMQMEDAEAVPIREDERHSNYLESLRLDRARIQAQLQKAKHPNHRAMLLKALAALEE